MKCLLSFLFIAAVFAASPDAAEQEQKVSVCIRRPGERTLRKMMWDVRGLAIDGKSVWAILCDHPYTDPAEIPHRADLQSDEHFKANAAIDGVLREFTKAIASKKGLDKIYSYWPITKDDAEYFKAEKWYWWSSETLLFLCAYGMHGAFPRGHVWLALRGTPVTIEGRKADTAESERRGLYK